MTKSTVTSALRFVIVGLALVLSACGGPAETPAAPAPGGGEVTPSSGGEATPAPSGQGAMVADLGFRPETNGFSFENYGKSDATNLTPDEVRRIFGDQVCASLANGQCTLTPPAEQWMVQQNSGMDGGHCYGFSVLSLRLFQGLITPADLGGGSTAADLQIQGNQSLQRELAYSFVFQSFDPVRAGAIQGTPNEILDKMIEIFKAGPGGESYTIGFFKAEGGGGHAVTPYAVEDRGNGTFAVLIYDNNFPKTTREIMFDRNADKWSYTASINPSEPEGLYEGDAQTKSLFLFPTSPGLQPQPCTICAAGAARGGGGRLAAPAQAFNEIYLDGNPEHHAHLLITDEQGHNYGYLPDGKFVSEISGVRHESPFLTDNYKMNEEPDYFVPLGMAFQLTVDGTLLKEADTTDVVMIGPGYDLGVFDVGLDPGQKDTIAFSSDGKTLSYKTDYNESPDIVLGIETPGADYSFLVKGVDIESGGSVNVHLDQEKGFLLLSSLGNKQTGTYALLINRIDDAGEQTFGHDEIQLEPDDTAFVEYLKWTGEGGELPLGIDRGSDGTIDETIMLSDAQ